jgi:hypothetical protein
MVVVVALHTGLSPAACTDTRHLSRLRRDVVHDVVLARAIRAHAGWNMIESQTVAHAPRDGVIGTTSRAYADAARERAVISAAQRPSLSCDDFANCHRLSR